MVTDRRDPAVTSVHVLAPAKLNLGLAILGKRPDAYHEIDTIMAMIDIHDEITVSLSGDGIRITGMDDVPLQSNLIYKAAHLWHAATGIDSGVEISIAKNIPSPGGIGGGSSDAAAVLLTLNDLHERPLSNADLHSVASKIGADCPFFLGTSYARATGIGTELRPVPPPTGHLVLVIPRTNIDAKTAALYGRLTAEDYGLTVAIDEIEQHLASGSLPEATLPNSFWRPAMQLFPGMRDLADRMAGVVGSVSLSGSGPTLFGLTESHETAERWAAELAELTAGEAQVTSAQFLQHRPLPEFIP